MRRACVAFAFVSRAPLFSHRHARATSPLRRATLSLATNVDEQLFGAAAAVTAQSTSRTDAPRFEYSAQRAAQSPREQGAEPRETTRSQIPVELASPPPHVLPTSITPRVQSSSQQDGASAKSAPAKLLPTPGVPPRAHGARVSSVRVLLQSPWLAQLRLPSRDRAIMMAGELALILSVLLLLRAGVSSTLRWVHTRLNATRGLNTNIPYEASVFECMQRPLQFLSLFTVGTALAEVVSRPLAATGLVKHIMTLRELSIIFSATWFLLRWINRIKTRFALDKRVDKAQVDATSRIATVAIVVVSLLISLDTIGVNIQTVLAFGGIGGVAIGFAGREIISNFFGGFMIYVTQPFSVGEWIRSIEERELNGTVEDIGWYLTRVRTWDKRPLYIPNSRFSTLIVENGSRMDNRRIVHTLHLRHEDMPVVLSIVTQIENLLMTHPELDPRQHRLAYVDSFDEYSVKLWFSCYTKSVFLYDFRRVQQDLLVKCHEIIRAAGAKLATRNTRDVRPGVDTDRYGPFGRNATFGSIANGVSVPEKISNAAPENYDVPGALQYGQRRPMFNVDSIESGIDPKRYNQHVSPPVPVPSSDFAHTGSQSPSDRDSSASKSLSEAAMEASAAAFLFAQRGAARKKDDNGSAPEAGLNQTERDDSLISAVDSPREPSTTPSSAGAQMKISRAPPRNEMLDTSMSSEGAGDGKALQNAPAAQMKISRAPPKGDGIDNSARDTANFEGGAEQRTPAPPSQQPVGQMRISRAPPRVDPSDSSPSAMADDLRNQQASVAAGQMKISRAPARNENIDSSSLSLDSTSSSPQMTRQTRPPRVSSSSEVSGNAALSGESLVDDKHAAATTPTGQMKISRAPPRREVNDMMGATGADQLGDAFNRQTASGGVVKTNSPQSSRPEEKTGMSHNTASTRNIAKESPTFHSTQAAAKASDKENQNQNVANHSSPQVPKNTTAVKGNDEGKSALQVTTSSLGKHDNETLRNLTKKQELTDNQGRSEESGLQDFGPTNKSNHATGDGHALSKHATPLSDEGKESSS